MNSPFKKLHDLAYHSYVDTDNYDPVVFASLSKLAGCPIPQEYMDFLCEFPDTGVFDVEGGVVIKGIEKLSGNHDGWHSIAMLYAGCSDKQYDLMEITGRPLYDGDTPRYALLIGDDVFGNAFCLDLHPDTFGKVYFWDHEHSADEAGLYLVAHDFVSFVNGLQIDA
jgi:SMI1 / KNR4 family (SUKH-1)